MCNISERFALALASTFMGREVGGEASNFRNFEFLGTRRGGIACERARDVIFKKKNKIIKKHNTRRD